jgi:2-polyprenyl-3-methyl-5-hydroxy-6-metoxy-1,4-benzoquinol methylase
VPDSESLRTPRAGTDDWERHWAAYAEPAALNPAQAYRRKLVFELLALDKATGPVRLIELGSGQGDFARDLAAAYPDVEIAGIDMSQKGVEIACRKVPRGTFFQCDLSRPVEPSLELSAWATHAVCSEVLEHVDDPAALLQNARPFFARGCKLVITVPGGPMSSFDRHIGHRRHFTTELLRKVIAESGLEAALVYGAGFPFFNLYRLMVVARGNALIDDLDVADGGKLGWAPRAAMRGFDWLFRWNRSETTRGWQLVARALEPA